VASRVATVGATYYHYRNNPTLATRFLNSGML
jgi:hypothetical protein